MASIRKEGKYYQLYYYQNGKKHKISTKTSSKRLAEKIKLEFENKLSRDSFGIPNYHSEKQMDLKDFIEEYIAYAKVNKAASTVKRDIEVLKNFLDFIGNKPLQNITVSTIESYKADRMGEAISLFTMNLELRHLKSAFSTAVKFEYLSRNPFFDVKMVRTPKKCPIFLSPEQAWRLLEHTQNTHIYQFIFIALYTGARRSEICGLTWKQVDFRNQYLRLTGKGNKERIVPLPNSLYNYLKEKKKNGLKLIEGSNRANEVTVQFRKYADEIGLFDFTFHNLRDTYASWLVQKGENIKIIQELLGHTSIQTTMIYAHIARENIMSVVTKLDAVQQEIELCKQSANHH